MKIILLSGGSGKRLWPLSNDARSKQFLKVLPAPNGGRESMIQRVVRQIREADLTDEIIVATGANQRDATQNQLGDLTKIVTEPARRDTFPAIMLACSYLDSEGTPDDEPVIVMPCDSFTEDSYFSIIGKMADAVKNNEADLVLMGIEPTYPSSKYGYIIPKGEPMSDGARMVRRFTEKPDVATAERLIKEGAMWNGGVFAFKLGYLMRIARHSAEEVGIHAVGGKLIDFELLRARYTDFPKISFDYAVVEKANSIAVISYSGQWKDLGTWNTLTDELVDKVHGNVLTNNCENTYIINELEIPLVSIGVSDMVIAASPDGIVVTDRSQSENLKNVVDVIQRRPMYERRRWGKYKVVDAVTFDDNSSALTKQLSLMPGCYISYQRHARRDEVWTFVDGEGEIIIDGKNSDVKRGDVFRIKKGQMHTLRAITPLTFIEVQIGDYLEEDDIERFESPW